MSEAAQPDPTVRDLPGADVVWEILVAEGVGVVFGYPGGAIMPAYDSLPRYPQIHHVLTRHEQSAAHMADGFARASGRVGVCVATSGPGATNLVTGLATAMMDSIPLVAITGQVSSAVLGTDAFQETDILGITVPVTKHGFLVTRTADIATALRKAFGIARSGRPGPVLVDITKDALVGSAPFVDPGPYRVERPRLPRPVVRDEDLDHAARLIAASERPVILAGQGVIAANATAELHELVARIDAPVASTLLGLGSIPHDHPRALGMMGMHGAPWVNTTIQQADLLIAVGMRFDDRVTGSLRTYAQNAKKIHIELDPSEINKVVDVDVGLCGDAKAVLRRLLDRVEAKAAAPWNETIDALRNVDIQRDILRRPDSEGLLAPQVIRDLWEATGGDAIIVTDVGQHQMWEAQYYEHDRPRSLITSGGLGTMGFALPAAMGARFAKPDAEIWVVVGDGGFQMTAAELATCGQERLRLNIAIINNGYLGMVRQWQEFFYERRYVSTPLHNPDFCLLAGAHGLLSRRVEHRSEVADAIAFARRDPGTTVVEFRVEAEANVFPMVATGRALDDMIRRPVPSAPSGSPDGSE